MNKKTLHIFLISSRFAKSDFADRKLLLPINRPTVDHLSTQMAITREKAITLDCNGYNSV